MGAAATLGGAPHAGWLDGVLTRVGSALDRAALAGMRLAFADAIHPTRRARAALAACAEPYLDAALQREPRRFFAFLDAPASPAVRTVASRDTAGGEIAVRELETAYEPWHASDAWPCCVENARVPFEHWMHRDGAPRGTVIALHGFTMGRPWIDAHVLMATQWFALGYDVVMPILPFHGTRAPRWTRYSGEAFGSWDVGRLNEAVRQAVHDVDLVRRWLASGGGGPVGLVGLSLGGYLTALVAGLCRELAFAIPVAAPSSLAWLPLTLAGAGRLARPRLPVAPDVLDAAYRVHCPLTYPLALPRARVFVVGGLGDVVVPPAQVHALWRHWGEPAMHWFSGGHTTPFGRAQIMARIEAHLATLD